MIKIDKFATIYRSWARLNKSALPTGPGRTEIAPRGCHESDWGFNIFHLGESCDALRKRKHFYFMYNFKI